MPFWSKKIPPVEPESLRMTSEEIDSTASDAVVQMLDTFRSMGYEPSPSRLQAVEEGEAFDRALKTFLNHSAATYFDNRAKTLSKAGVKDPECFKVIGQNADAVNRRILLTLQEKGFDVANLLADTPS